MLTVPLFLAAISGSPDKVVLATVSDTSKPPPGWVVVTPPQTEQEWYCANYSDDLQIVKVGDAVQILAGPRDAQPTLSLSAGTLVGINRGEFGGEIQWHDRLTDSVSTVRRDNPVAFLAQDSRIFVFVGLAHLTMDEGEVLELKRTKKGGWTASEVMGLGAAPDAIVPLSGGDVLVLTTTGVLKINPVTRRKVRLLKNPQWSFIYANSIAQLDDSILVGARRAIIRLRLEKGRHVEEWWVRANCRKQLGKRCECQP